MFERFTHEARDVAARAAHEAERLGHGSIGTAHVLVSLADDEGAAGRTLRSLGVSSDELRASVRPPSGRTELDAEALATIGIDLEAVRRRVEDAFGPGALEHRRRRRGRRGVLPFEPVAKKVLELALREALQRGDRRIDAAHILLGVLRGGDRPALELLEGRGLPRETVRAALLRELGDG